MILCVCVCARAGVWFSWLLSTHKTFSSILWCHLLSDTHIAALDSISCLFFLFELIYRFSNSITNGQAVPYSPSYCSEPNSIQPSIHSKHLICNLIHTIRMSHFSLPLPLFLREIFFKALNIKAGLSNERGLVYKQSSIRPPLCHSLVHIRPFLGSGKADTWPRPIV